MSGFEIRREQLRVISGRGPGRGPALLESGRIRPTVEVDVEFYSSSPENPFLLLIPPLTCPAGAVGERSRGRGWWNDQIGPGRSLDTDRFTIISLRPHLGGTSEGGVESVRDDWTIRDIAHLLRDALRSIGIDYVAGIIGPSFGGMVALEWGLLYPESCGSLLLLGVGAETNASRLALNLVGLRILELCESGLDEREGLAVARSLALLCYRGAEELDVRFGRGRSSDGWLVGWYLDRQGEKFVERISAREYTILLNALNSHDVGRDRGGASRALGRLRMPVLCVGFSSDRLYPADEVEKLARAIPQGEYLTLDSPYGHDAFLIEGEELRKLVSPFLARVSEELKNNKGSEREEILT